MDTIAENKAVGLLTELFAIECGYGPTAARQIRMAAILHDCGKTCIPKAILDKPGKLTAEEFEIMKNHTKAGAGMLSSLRGEPGEMARKSALWHHEHFDGNGYWSLCSADIPKYVQIISICDVLCALLFKRIYRAPSTPEEALEHIKTLAGTQFCPELTSAFIPLISNDEHISAIFMNYTEVSA